MKEYKILYSYMIVEKKTLDFVDYVKSDFILEVKSRGDIDTKDLIHRVTRIAEQACKKNQIVRDANYYGIVDIK